MKLSTLNGKMSLISVGTNAKTKKGDSDLAVTAIMYLAPSTISGYETCPSKSKGCSEACLFTAGRGAMNSVQQARVRKTKLFFEKQDQFLANLKNDLTLFDSYCKQEGLQGYVRLNGTSDIKWEDFDLFSSFPNIRFYDYTKRTDRDFENLPSNYKLTFSRSEDTTDEELLDLVKNINVSVVFTQVPETHLGIKVIEGDLTDLRWEDPSNVIVGLKAKGLAKSDDTGFVIQPKLINNINI
jgi:hypothetical protein